MDAAVLNDPITNKNEPVIALFYNENKVDIIKEEDFTLKNTLVISEWSDESASNKEGFIILLPYSDFLVVAKEGESKVIFKNYMKIGQNDRVLQTGLKNINHIFLSPDHKIITVFDRVISAMIQFFVPEISCSNDPLIASCSLLYMNEKVECVKNAVWNIAEKKCYCVGGYFLHEDQITSTRSCQKCKCTEPGHYCQNKATECYEESYFTMNLSDVNDVSALGCWIYRDIEWSQGYIQTTDENNQGQYQINLKTREYRRVAASRTLSQGEKRGFTAMKCMNRDTYENYGYGAYAVTGGRTLTKVWDARARYFNGVA